MDSGKQARKPHPLNKANCLSALTFWWTFPTFYLGYSRDLEIEDLYEPLSSHKSNLVGDKLEKHWNAQLLKTSKKSTATPSLFRAIARTFGPRFMSLGLVLLFVEMVVKVAQPIFLGRLIMYFSAANNSITKDTAYLYAAGVIASSGLAVFMLHPYMMAIIHIGMKSRVAACSLIYRKALRLSHSAMGQTTAGQVVNLLSNDVNRFDVAPMFLHYLWVGPLETALISYLLWAEMGWSAMFGMATMLATIPLQGWLGKKTSSLRLKTAVRTDERVRLMNEIISGIQVIKMYTWEKPFAKLVHFARKKEIKQIRIASYIRGGYLSFIMFTTRVTLYTSVIAYVLLGNEITAQKVFVMASYYNIIRQTMTIFFPQAIAQMAEGSISVKRIQKFLLLDEINVEHRIGQGHEVNGPEVNEPEVNEVNKVTMVKGKAQWSEEKMEPTLTDISLTMKSGQLVAVIGPVGSGKSSLIHAILGELPLTSGTVEVRGQVSYAAQEPWLFSSSVKQNIIFGQPWDAARYREVVKVCALERDFSQFPYGDKTVVGERGVSLSGGQRARVSLARAVYKRADVYLLDDPLSAVDAHVGRHLFEDCIRGFLRDKAVLLVTHQLQFLAQANHIIILHNGQIEIEGSYQQLQASGLDFAELLAAGEDEDEGEENPDDQLENGGSESQGTPQQGQTRRRRRTSSRKSSDGSVGHLEGLMRQISERSGSLRSSQEIEQVTQKGTEDAGPQEVAEVRSKGTVSGKVYGQYLKAGGNTCTIIVMFSLFVLAQLAGSGADYWITYWTNWEEVRNLPNTVRSPTSPLTHANNSEVTDDLVDLDNSTSTLSDRTVSGMDWLTTEICIYIYTGIIVGLLTLSFVRSYLFFKTCMAASTNLHNNMFSAITRATMAFFNNNPSGRILNRFSKDVGSIDEMLPQAMIDALQIGLTLLGIIVVVAIVNFWLMLPTGIIAVIFYFLRIVYLNTSRSVKRLEGVTRSPVFTHLNASIQGLTTIRAFEAQDILRSQFDQHQDLHSAAWYLFIASSRAFGFWLDVICFFYIALVTLSFLIMEDASKEQFGGDVGLAITQAIGLTGMFQWGMRQSAELENQMTSVERVLEFSEVESEPPLETKPGNEPPKGWPEKGEITFEKLSLRYNPDDPPVLKEISFTINPGEKIGIVGRTGAGKSSLISALFRLADVTTGRILIDGVDTATIGLHLLRANVSIIPQEPVLFSGTLRKNLDPFDEFSDDVLWQALSEVELKEAISELAGGLSAHMSEGGSNLSVGQRQLVCLARAVVRNNKLLVLDEATANVDPKTDALIQNTIRRKFARCTVLTIAHRLHTVMDADRVLVMDSGRVAELASPAQLLDDPQSLLAQMAAQTGAATAHNLRQRAHSALANGGAKK